MLEIEINHDWCKGCYICVDICPKKVLEKDQATFLRGFHPVMVARPEACTACRLCELLCPDLAITVKENPSQYRASLCQRNDKIVGALLR